MRQPSVLIAVLSVIALAGCHFNDRQPQAQPVATATKTKDDYNRPLAPGEAALREVDIATMPDAPLGAEDRTRLLAAIAHSLAYLATGQASSQYPISGISKDQVVRSLQVLTQLVQGARDEADFNRQLKRRFRALMSVGCDRRGTVLFSGYYTPILDASLTPTATFRYPVYQSPGDLIKATDQDHPASQRLPSGETRPYPTRAELEGSGALKGHELVYFQDPFDAYVVEVQGSAKIRLPNGEQQDIGFADTNGHPYHAIAKDLLAEGKIRAADLALVRDFFHAHPGELAGYLARNPRVVFLRRTNGGPFGNLGQAVTTDVTVATDKSIFPPGAACLAATTIASPPGQQPAAAGLRLDQDRGGAIRAAGRCDLYMGVGEAAGARAGTQFAEGRLYYLLLRD
jgi:membrane-bound lytic murein transglycosylase A